MTVDLDPFHHDLSLDRVLAVLGVLADREYQKVQPSHHACHGARGLLAQLCA